MGSADLCRVLGHSLDGNTSLTYSLPSIFLFKNVEFTSSPAHPHLICIAFLDAGRDVLDNITCKHILSNNPKTPGEA